MATIERSSHLGLLLKRHRLAAGLSQEELAERAGLSRRGISDLERGARRMPHPATLRRLAEALGLAEGDHTALLNAAGVPGSGTLDRDAILVDGQVRHNLPLQLTSFFGRRQEIADICREMTMRRQLSLTGPGGVGKTRLALEAASGLTGAYAHGTWLVDLGPVRDPHLVPLQVGHAETSPERVCRAGRGTETGGRVVGRRICAIESYACLAGEYGRGFT
jgi:transcriptional regulator with XRE-family HTH domain